MTNLIMNYKTMIFEPTFLSDKKYSYISLKERKKVSDMRLATLTAVKKKNTYMIQYVIDQGKTTATVNHKLRIQYAAENNSNFINCITSLCI